MKDCKECKVSAMNGRITHKWQCPVNVGKRWYVPKRTKERSKDAS